MGTPALPWAACSNAFGKAFTSFGKEILPNIQPKPPPVPLEVVFSCPVFCCSGDGSSHQIFVRHEGFGNNKKNPKHIYVCVIKETGSQALLLIT